MEPKYDIAKLTADLERATTDYKDAERQESAARSAATAALNTLNSAQRAFMEAFASMKNSAPLGSDWKCREHRRVD